MQRELIRPDETFDLIIVGAGLSGSILGARIAQFGVNPRNGEKLKIAMFDGGPYWKGDPIRGYGNRNRRAAFDGMLGEDARYTFPWGFGCVGGSAIHAGMISYPILPIDFDHWREASGVDWTWENFQDSIAEMYAMWHPYPEPEAIRAPGQQRFREVALAMGLNVHEVGIAKLNCPRCGCCNGHLCKYDAKSSGLVTYIPICEREGVRIIPDTTVEKVLIEKKGSRPVATGVAYKFNGGLRRAFASRVIVSCSMAGTPRLLHASGYGPRDKVKGELLAENGNVGANHSGSFRLHLQCLFGEPIKNPEISSHCVYYVLKTLGPGGYNNIMITENFGCREGSGNAPVEHALDDLAPAFGREHKQFMKKAQAHWGWLTPQIAKIRVRPGPAEDEREVLTLQSLQKNHPEVIEGLREAMEITVRIAKDMGAVKWTGHQKLPQQFSFGFDNSLCRAGASPQNSVVNSDFECHDIDGLFVCDRSVPPCQATANVSMPLAVVTNYAWRRIVLNHFSR